MRKKLISLTLCASICILNGFVISAFATSLHDVSGTKYETAVTKLVSEAVLSGYEDGSFQPEKSITRAETVTIIVNAMEPNVDALSLGTANHFKDVPENYWAAKSINYAVARGVVSGFEDGTFRPESKVTYYEMAAMLVNALGYDKTSLQSSWPQNYQNKAEELGMFAQMDTKTADFQFEGSAIRGDVALMVYSVYDALKAGGNESLSESDSEESELASNSVAFTGEKVKLSLEEAVKKMKSTGYLAQMAEINKKSDQSVAKGYSESASKIKHYLKFIDNLPLKVAYEIQEEGVSQPNYDMLKIQRDFARANINSNYEADMNSIEQKTVQLYYGVIQAEDNVRVCTENLAVQNAILKNVEQKYLSGKATKLEVTSQQKEVLSSQQSLKEASDQLSKAKMQFNMLLGYDIMQDVNYTDSLTLLDMPEIDLKMAIKKAQEERLDYKRLQMTNKMYTIYRNNMRAQYADTSKALSAEATLLMIKLNVENMPKNIEMEIRGLYNDLKTNYQAIETAKTTLALAEEALRVKTLLYDSGLTTLAEVQKAQITVYQTNQLLTAKISAFDLATYEWKYATGVGTQRIEF